MNEFMASFSVWQIGMVCIALFLGGMLKGVTGGGAPIVAIPVMSAFVSLPVAVMVMLLPNLVTSLRQAFQFRHDAPEQPFLICYLGAGVVGVSIGAVVLVSLPERPLEVGVSCAVLAYVALRISRPRWNISNATALRLATPAGVVAGFLQGATGLSAPATLSFLNAVNFPRRTFIATLSLLFLFFSVFHMAALILLGSYTVPLVLSSAIAILPVFLGVEVGSSFCERIPPAVFDKVILALLVAVAMKVLLQ